MPARYVMEPARRAQQEARPRPGCGVRGRPRHVTLPANRSPEAVRRVTEGAGRTRGRGDGGAGTPARWGWPCPSPTRLQGCPMIETKSMTKRRCSCLNSPPFAPQPPRKELSDSWLPRLPWQDQEYVWGRPQGHPPDCKGKEKASVAQLLSLPQASLSLLWNCRSSPAY